MICENGEKAILYFALRRLAGLGLGAAELTWWQSDKVFKNDRLAVGVTGNGVCLIVNSE